MEVTREQFVAMLRSGHYEQIRGGYRINDGFCAQGVACDMVDPEEWKIINLRPDGSVTQAWGDFGWFANVSAVDIGVGGLFDWMDGVQSKNMRILNDGGWTFDQIADWVEAGMPDDAVTGADVGGLWDYAVDYRQWMAARAPSPAPSLVTA